MIRVYIADDRSLVREGLRRLLEEEADISVVGTARDAYELLEGLRETKCDVVVLDIQMPGPGFLETLSRVRASRGGPRVLVLSGSPEESFAVRALQEGALGYLHKDAEPEEMIAAVRDVGHGRRYVSRRLADLLVESLNRAPGEALHEELSGREFQVLTLLGSGKTADEVAHELHISPKTVNTYRSRIYEKLGLKGMPQLIRYAVERGLVE